MKIALPSSGDKLSSTINPSYGRAPYYYVYDRDKKEGSFLPNGAAGGAGGVGVKAAQVLVDAGVSVLITPRLGDNAAQVLYGAGIELYLSQGTGLEENIESYLEGRLEKLTEIHEGHHGH